MNNINPDDLKQMLTHIESELFDTKIQIRFLHQQNIWISAIMQQWPPIFRMTSRKRDLAYMLHETQSLPNSFINLLSHTRQQIIDLNNIIPTLIEEAAGDNKSTTH